MNFLMLFLTGLGNDDWKVREWCGSALRSQEYVAVGPLFVGLECQDAEVRRRSRDLLCELHPAWHSVRVERMRRMCVKEIGRWPWIDSMPADTPGKAEIVSHYVRGAQEWHNEISSPPDWPAYQRATELFVTVMLDGMSPGSEESVKNLLLGMCAREKKPKP